MRTVITFESAAFNTSESRPYFLNPESFGDDVARWLGERLRAAGASSPEEPGQEDFGWYVEFTVPEGAHCCVIGFRPGDDVEPGTWIVQLERSRGLLQSLLGRRQHGISAVAIDALHGILSEADEITNLRWHRQDDFRAGREELGALTPHEA
jgi:hypothetical protein